MMYASNRPLRLIAAGLCLLPLITACGQKGPLYLPGDRSETQTAIPLPDTEGEDGDEEPASEDGQ